MYSDERIGEIFKGIVPNDEDSKAWFDAYTNIYKQSFLNPTKSDKFNYHHFFCSFLYKTVDDSIEKKNRYHTIDKLDEKYSPLDNVCKLRILCHVLAHYYLGMALRNTEWAVDARNAFFVLVGDYNRSIESYSLEEVKELGRLVEENSLPNTVNRYMTQSERKEMGKQRAKENRERWKEEHKDEIEERKRKQREWAKKTREEWKAKKNSKET